jgi:hypothetical protein
MTEASSTEPVQNETEHSDATQDDHSFEQMPVREMLDEAQHAVLGDLLTVFESVKKAGKFLSQTDQIIMVLT